MSSRKLRVAIVGAGAAGLCCARHLSEFPEKFEVQVFEKASEVGGTWVYTDNTDTDEMGLPVHSSVYRSLRTNVPKEIMGFRDFPFKPNNPHVSYIYHWEVLRYLQEYAAHYRLNRFIKFRTLVEQVVPCSRANTGDAESKVANGAAPDDSLGRGGEFRDEVSWLVTTRDFPTGRQTTEKYDVVLVCNGHLFKPYLPTDIPGLDKFPGTTMHSHSYREPSRFRNQRVLVVGASLSGIDIAFDVATEADAVYLCNRNAWITCDLPENVEQLPAVEAIESDGTVSFMNKVKRKVDTIVLCTGYDYDFPFLTKEVGIHMENRRIIHLYKHTFNATYPSMAFIGMNTRIIPFPLFDLQVSWVLKVWDGEKQLPSSEEMVADSDRDYQERLERGLPPHHAHHLGPLIWTFQKELAELGGSEPFPPVMQKLNRERTQESRKDVIHYKDRNYAIVSQDEWIDAPNEHITNFG